MSRGYPVDSQPVRRAALLPTPGDPFMFGYWLRNFETWAREVDELHVLVNGQADEEVLAYIDRLATAAAFRAGHELFSFRHVDRLLGHGEALALLLEQTDAELVVFLEDDAWVRRPGSVALQFERIRQGQADVIGSPRGCASSELINLAWARWPESEFSSSGDSGHGLWPCFLFARRADLLATDRRFEALLWPAGELVPGLDHVSAEATSADTFVSVSWQLRAAGKRVLHVPQFRIATTDFLAEWMLLNPEWFHAGSLSTGYGVSFADEAGRTTLDILQQAATGHPEWARRIFWWERFQQTADDALPEQQARYRAELDRIIGLTGARGIIDTWGPLVEPWITWKETA